MSRQDQAESYKTKARGVRVVYGRRKRFALETSNRQGKGVGCTWQKGGPGNRRAGPPSFTWLRLLLLLLRLGCGQGVVMQSCPVGEKGGEGERRGRDARMG